MKIIIETPRCFLRELSVTDAEHFYLLNQDLEVIKYTGDSPFESIQAAKEFLQNYNPYVQYGYGRWAVIDKSNSEFLGWCGLKYSPDLDEVDIGFRFFKKYWNQGFATEAAKASIEYGFTTLHLHKIVGRAMEANVASIKVLEKIGLTFINKLEFHLHAGVLYQIENPNKASLNK
jgi:RimJ/RimL family protein N-acetyltransferase